MRSSAGRFSIKLITGLAVAFALLTQGQVAKAQLIVMCDTLWVGPNPCAGEVPGGTNYGSSFGPANVGDPWYFALYTYPYAPIDACDQAGCTSGGAMGTADAYGDFVLYGTFTSDEIGSWWETWYAGPYPSYPTNTIYFTVPDDGSGGGGGGGGGSSPCGITISPQTPNVIYASSTYDFDTGTSSYDLTGQSSQPSYVEASTQGGCTISASPGSGANNGSIETSSTGSNMSTMSYEASAVAYPGPPPPYTMVPEGCFLVGVSYLSVSFTAKGTNFSSSTGSVNFELDSIACYYDS